MSRTWSELGHRSDWTSQSNFAPTVIRVSTTMRASSVLFACVLATLLLLTFAADEAYWMPTEEDLAHVQRAVISVRHCPISPL